MKDTLILDFIHSLPRHPDRTLVLVIDALDGYGNPQSRRNILKVLTDAATQAPWLKVIITSSTDPRSISNASLMLPPGRRVYDMT